jgi:hypothetical protein
VDERSGRKTVYLRIYAKCRVSYRPPALVALCPNSFERGAASHVAAPKEPTQWLGVAMLREIVVEEEMPGNLQTTFRLRVDENLIAENVTELETQFLVSEMLERIPSLRIATSDDAEQPEAIAPPCRREGAGALSE